MTLDLNQARLQNVPHSPQTSPECVCAPDLFRETSDALTLAVNENIYRSRLMAHAGHDLKQPLQVLGMLLELLAADVDQVIAASRLKLAHQAITRIADGLDELALASKREIGRDVPSLQSFQVADILKAMKPRWSEHAAHNHVELRVGSCGAYVTSNVAMLTTILDNLVGNAIKYARGASVLIGCRRAGDNLRIEVIDTGIGIAAEQLDRIFEAFYQSDPRGDGLGLGLSIVQRTAAILGHRLKVRSEFGRGSSFSVEVPLDLTTSARTMKRLGAPRVAPEPIPSAYLVPFLTLGQAAAADVR